MLTSKPKAWPAFLFTLMVLALPGANECLRAQEPCAPPPAPVAARAKNIFSEQQEVYLGDAIAEYMARNFRVSSDERLTAYFSPIANRLLKHMPPAQLHLQFLLVDLGEANAFSVAGGRIYVSPKVIALTRSEDEVAGVLAHELGHLVSHQTAHEISRGMERVLQVTQVSDRRDVFDKFHLLLENSWRKSAMVPHEEKEDQEDQQVADRLALYALAGAGYSVESFAAFFDRLAGTEGKTGNWFSVIFGAEKPEAKRLREMARTASTMPAGCIEHAPKASQEAFKAWQAEVIDYSGWNTQEVLHDVARKWRLDPPLRGEIKHLKFSPDGKYVLAQDDGNIYVLSRQPFAPLLQIDAAEAEPAQFSPDSRSVVFYNAHLRVEAWDVAEHKRIWAHEIIERQGCLQSDLAPDGSVFACLEKVKEGASGLDLVLFDVATGAELLRKTSFDPNWALESFELLFATLLNAASEKPFALRFISTSFSPEGRYFLAAHSGKSLLYDLRERDDLSIPGRLGRQLTGSFAFLDDHRIVAVNGGNPAKSHVLSFPSGENLQEVSLGSSQVTVGTHGDIAMIRPVKDYPLGLADLSTGKPLFAFKRSALDVFDQVFVAEERDGELGLHDMKTGKVLTLTTLPGGHFGALRAACLSPDWDFLAASEADRGAVWDLSFGTRLYHIRGFQGAYLPNQYVLYADFPKFNETERNISQLSLRQSLVQVRPPLQDKVASQHGQYLVVTKSPDKIDWNHWGAHQTLEIRDVTTGATLWSREFPKEGPSYTVDAREQRMVCWWSASSPQARDEMQNFPVVSDRISSRTDRQASYFVEVLDAQTGKILGAFAAETGKGRLLDFSDAHLAPHSAGDWVALSGGENHVLVYSLSSGNEVGRYFGHDPEISAASGLLSLENEPGHLTLSSLATGQDLDRWVFTSPVSLQEFSRDGKRLFVLTSDQTAYVLDVSRFSRQGPTVTVIR
jgi:WD40 repeat protein